MSVRTADDSEHRRGLVLGLTLAEVLLLLLFLLMLILASWLTEAQQKLASATRENEQLKTTVAAVDPLVRELNAEGAAATLDGLITASRERDTLRVEVDGLKAQAAV